MESLIRSEAGKEPVLIAGLRDFSGLDRVRAAARRQIGTNPDVWIDKERARRRLSGVLESAGWSAGCVGINDAATVVRVVREEAERASLDVSALDLGRTALSAARRAIAEGVDEDPPPYIPPSYPQAETSAREAAVEWAALNPNAVASEVAAVLVRTAGDLARTWPAIDFRDVALIVAIAFKDAGARMSEGVLVDAENAAYDACRLSTEEGSVLAAAEASLLLEEQESWVWSEEDEEAAYAEQRERLDSSLIARLEGSAHAREAAEKVAPNLTSWILYNSETYCERVRQEEWERDNRSAIHLGRAKLAPAPAYATRPAKMAEAAAEVTSARVRAPIDVESEPGVLGDLARFSLSSAFRPVREFAIPSALAVIATVFGRRFVTPTGAGLNLYMVALAGTGVGKEDLLKAPQTILSKASLGHLLGPGDFTSDSAIEATVRAHPSVFVPLDEFGQFVQAFQGHNAPAFAKSLRKTLLEIFSKSGLEGRWTGKQKAADGIDKASDPIYSPTLTLLGCSTVDGFFEGLTEANFTDGFINRLIVVRGGRPGPRNPSHARLTPPSELIEELQAMCEASSASGGNLSASAARNAGTRPALQEVPWAGDEAQAAWEEVCVWQDAAEEAGRSGTTARAAENTLKVATLRALARAPSAPAVTADDVRWGWRLIETSIETVEEGARQNMAGSEFEAAVKAIERAVVAAGPEGITRADLDKTRGVSKLPDRVIEEALKRLERGEAIVQGIVKIPGKPGRPRLRIQSTIYTGKAD